MTVSICFRGSTGAAPGKFFFMNMHTKNSRRAFPSCCQILFSPGFPRERGTNFFQVGLHPLESSTTVSICVSLSKLKLISSAMIGSLNLMDLSH